MLAIGNAVRDWTYYDHTSAIIEHEEGQLSDEGVIELFQYLVDTGMAWGLQGSYGRQAEALIERGLVARTPFDEPMVLLEEFLQS
jgi:hypothetical protein